MNSKRHQQELSPTSAVEAPPQRIALAEYFIESQINSPLSNEEIQELAKSNSVQELDPHPSGATNNNNNNKNDIDNKNKSPILLSRFLTAKQYTEYNELYRLVGDFDRDSQVVGQLKSSNNSSSSIDLFRTLVSPIQLQVIDMTRQFRTSSITNNPNDDGDDADDGNDGDDDDEDDQDDGDMSNDRSHQQQRQKRRQRHKDKPLHLALSDSRDLIWAVVPPRSYFDATGAKQDKISRLFEMLDDVERGSIIIVKCYGVLPAANQRPLLVLFEAHTCYNIVSHSLIEPVGAGDGTGGALLSSSIRVPLDFNLSPQNLITKTREAQAAVERNRRLLLQQNNQYNNNNNNNNNDEKSTSRAVSASRSATASACSRSNANQRRRRGGAGGDGDGHYYYSTEEKRYRPYGEIPRREFFGFRDFVKHVTLPVGSYDEFEISDHDDGDDDGDHKENDTSNSNYNIRTNQNQDREQQQFFHLHHHHQEQQLFKNLLDDENDAELHISASQRESQSPARISSRPAMITTTTSMEDPNRKNPNSAFGLPPPPSSSPPAAAASSSSSSLVYCDQYALRWRMYARVDWVSKPRQVTYRAVFKEFHQQLADRYRYCDNNTNNNNNNNYSYHNLNKNINSGTVNGDNRFVSVWVSDVRLTDAHGDSIALVVSFGRNHTKRMKEVFNAVGNVVVLENGILEMVPPLPHVLDADADASDDDYNYNNNNNNNCKNNEEQEEVCNNADPKKTILSAAARQRKQLRQRQRRHQLLLREYALRFGDVAGSGGFYLWIDEEIHVRFLDRNNNFFLDNNRNRSRGGGGAASLAGLEQLVRKAEPSEANQFRCHCRSYLHPSHQCDYSCTKSAFCTILEAKSRLDVEVMRHRLKVQQYYSRQQQQQQQQRRTTINQLQAVTTNNNDEVVDNLNLFASNANLNNTFAQQEEDPSKKIPEIDASIIGIVRFVSEKQEVALQNNRYSNNNDHSHQFNASRRVIILSDTNVPSIISVLTLWGHNTDLVDENSVGSTLALRSARILPTQNFDTRYDFVNSFTRQFTTASFMMIDMMNNANSSIGRIGGDHHNLQANIVCSIRAKGAGTEIIPYETVISSGGRRGDQHKGSKSKMGKWFEGTTSCHLREQQRLIDEVNEKQQQQQHQFVIAITTDEASVADAVDGSLTPSSASQRRFVRDEEENLLRQRQGAEAECVSDTTLQNVPPPSRSAQKQLQHHPDEQLGGRGPSAKTRVAAGDEPVDNFKQMYQVYHQRQAELKKRIQQQRQQQQRQNDDDVNSSPCSEARTNSGAADARVTHEEDDVDEVETPPLQQHRNNKPTFASSLSSFPPILLRIQHIDPHSVVRVTCESCGRYSKYNSSAECAKGGSAGRNISNNNSNQQQQQLQHLLPSSTSTSSSTTTGTTINYRSCRNCGSKRFRATLRLLAVLSDGVADTATAVVHHHVAVKLLFDSNKDIRDIDDRVAALQQDLKDLTQQRERVFVARVAVGAGTNEQQQHQQQQQIRDEIRSLLERREDAIKSKINDVQKLSPEELSARMFLPLTGQMFYRVQLKEFAVPGVTATEDEQHQQQLRPTFSVLDMDVTRSSTSSVHPGVDGIVRRFEAI